MGLFEELLEKKVKLSVIGLGYIGLPLFIELSKYFDVIGYDNNRKKIEQLINGLDITQQIESEVMLDLKANITHKEKALAAAKFHIIAVPTPVYKNNKPNIKPLIKASEAVGRNLSRGSVVVYESTVYPGLIEEICIPILEKVSGLSCYTDFKVGYSPERINPGDKLHTLINTVKIVSAVDNEALELLYKVYGSIVKRGIYKAPSIKVAEAAKILENCQRDINIAFINEMSMLFNQLGIDTKEVLKAANTKWNFINFVAGMVGGHCIAVDPYYLMDIARRKNYKLKVLSSCRKVNENMPNYIGENIVRLLQEKNMKAEAARVMVLGITFKENCSDIRNSKTAALVKLLQQKGMEVYTWDPTADKEEVLREYGIELKCHQDIPPVDVIVFAVAHNEFREYNLSELMERVRDKKCSILIDIKNIFDKNEALELGYTYWSL